VLLWSPAELVGDAPADGYTRVRGALHVHTSLSDGGGTPEDVAAAARAAGLQFVVVNDHNHLEAKPYEGWHDGVLVVVGTEISTDRGHVTAVGVRDPGFRFSGGFFDALDDVAWLGGHAFAAHPMTAREDLRFTGWDEPGRFGVEAWNGDSAWRAAGPLGWLSAAVAYPFDSRYALASTLRTPAGVLGAWDRLLARRDAPAVAGADAHQRLSFQKQEGTRKGRALPLPSYTSLLGLFGNHVLLEAPLAKDGPRDARTIADALGRGRVYVAVDAIADGSGFSFTAESPVGRATMGDTVAPGPSLTLRAGGRLPRGAQVKLLRDGGEVASGEGSLSLAAPPEGVYRVEVWIPRWDFPWLLSNPIVVAGPERAAARSAAASLAPPAPVAPVQVIDDFGGASTFGPEFDPSSQMASPVAVPGAGPDGSPAAVIDFKLGEPGPGRPHTWCSLVSRRARDLTGRTGLSFQVKSDRPLRVWVQVRDENPASADEGTEWWFGSVRTSPEWQRVNVPFRRLRSINPKTDGTLDLDKVRLLVLGVDAGALRPPASAKIVIDDLGVY
jgi:hypothetical protein